MQEIGNFDDIKTTVKEDLTENKVEIAAKIENDLNILDLIKNGEKEMKWINNDYMNYTNFKLKNEEVELKFECDDTYMNSAGREEEQDSNNLEDIKQYHCLKLEEDSLTDEIKKCEHRTGNNVDSNELTCDSKKNIENDFKSISKTKKVIIKLKNDYMLMHHTTNHEFTKTRRNINTKKLYKCELCDYQTVVRRRLSIHKLTHGITDGFPLLQCYHCTYETFYKSSLINHMKAHHKIKDFKCAFCSKGFTRKSYFNKHLLTFHNSTDNITRKQHYCNQCSYKTYNKQYLKQHVQTHELKCSYCSKGFVDKRYLDNHLLKIHNYRDVTKKIYNCDQCSYETVLKRLLPIHKLQHGIIDTKIQILKCHLCGYETIYKTNLRKHIKAHRNIKDFKCTYCSQEFTKKITLDHHLLKIHKCNITTKLYDCSQCSYVTVAKSRLLTHKLTHGATDGFQIFKCFHCSYKTFFKASLIRHLEKHKDVRDFKCTYCPKGFKRKTHLNNHLLRIHKCKDNFTTKEYACDKCSFESVYKSELLRHKIKHGITDGFQILKCNKCSYETYKKGHLERHMKSHKNIKEFKCTQCSKEYTRKETLKFHKCKGATKK